MFRLATVEAVSVVTTSAILDIFALSGLLVMFFTVSGRLHGLFAFAGYIIMHILLARFVVEAKLIIKTEIVCWFSAFKFVLSMVFSLAAQFGDGIFTYFSGRGFSDPKFSCYFDILGIFSSFEGDANKFFPSNMTISTRKRYYSF